MAIYEKRLNVLNDVQARISAVVSHSQREREGVGRGKALKQLTVDRGAKDVQAAHHPPSETRVGGTFSL